MTKAEMEKKLKEQQEVIDSQKKRIREQNKAAKEKWDCVSCRLPSGTKDRIKALGLSVNGFLRASVEERLDRLETERKENLASGIEPPF